ncbi:MAG TPA: hypothetical protein VEI02_03975 [Planctomycetota bacterium]|nr:hypothetical protein [Planctomycetota bacterium]
MPQTDPRGPRHAAGRRWRVFLAPLLALGGCAHEETPVGPPSISMEGPERRITGYHQITVDGRSEGWMETYVLGPGDGRTMHRILDRRRNPVGYVDDTGSAYRYTAYEGPQLVARRDDLTSNLRAVLEISGDRRIELVDLAPARR